MNGADHDKNLGSNDRVEQEPINNRFDVDVVDGIVIYQFLTEKDMEFHANHEPLPSREEQEFFGFDVRNQSSRALLDAFNSQVQNSRHDKLNIPVCGNRATRITGSLSDNSTNCAAQELGSKDSDGQQPIERYVVDIVDGIEIFQFLTEEDMEFHANHEPLPSREEQEFLGFDVRYQPSRILLDAFKTQVKNSRHDNNDTDQAARITGHFSVEDIADQDLGSQEPPLCQDEQETIGVDVHNKPSSDSLDLLTSKVVECRLACDTELSSDPIDTIPPDPPTITITTSEDEDADEDCVIVSVSSAPRKVCKHCGRCKNIPFMPTTEIVSLDSDEEDVNTSTSNLKYGFSKSDEINNFNIVTREDSANTSISSFKRGCYKNSNIDCNIENNASEEGIVSITTSKPKNGCSKGDNVTYNNNDPEANYATNTSLVHGCTNTGDAYFNKSLTKEDTSCTVTEYEYSIENVDINYNNRIPKKDNTAHGDEINYQITNNTTLINDSEKQNENLDEIPTLIITGTTSLAHDHNYFPTLEDETVSYRESGCTVSFSESSSDLTPTPSTSVNGDVIYVIDDDDTSLVSPVEVGSRTLCDTVSNHALENSKPNLERHSQEIVGSARSHRKRRILSKRTLKSPFSSENPIVVNRHSISKPTVDEISICLDSDDETNSVEPKQFTDTKNCDSVDIIVNERNCQPKITSFSQGTFPPISNARESFKTVNCAPCKKIVGNDEIEGVVKNIIDFVCRMEEIRDIPVREEHEECYSNKNVQTLPLCGKEYCAMGCVCYCIRRNFKRNRCNNHECIFGCVCFKSLKPRRHSSTDSTEQKSVERKSYPCESKNREINSDFEREKLTIPPKHSRRKQSLQSFKDISPLDCIVLKPTPTKYRRTFAPQTIKSPSNPNQFLQMMRQSWKSNSIFKKKMFRSNLLGLNQLTKRDTMNLKQNLMVEEHTPKFPVQSCPPTQNVSVLEGPPPAFALTCMTPGIGYVALQEFDSSILRLSDPFDPNCSRTFTSVTSAITWLNHRLMECLKLDPGLELKWVVANSVMIERKKIKCFDRNVLLDPRCRITKNGVLFI